jgi:hypothetical protein
VVNSPVLDLIDGDLAALQRQMHYAAPTGG